MLCKNDVMKNKPILPPRWTLYRLCKNTDPAQIHWSGNLRDQGQMYKKITTIYPYSKICSIKTTSCENKPTSLRHRTLCMLFKNVNLAQIHRSADLQGQGQIYKKTPIFKNVLYKNDLM